jgi:hypothetical protein
MIFPDREDFVGFIRFSLEGTALHVGVIAVSKDAPRGTGRILFDSAVRAHGITSVHGRLITGEGVKFFQAMQAEHPEIEFPILVGSSWLPPPKQPRRRNDE